MAFTKKFGKLLNQAMSSSSSIYQGVRCMSSSKLFIGGLSYNTDDQSLKEAFTSYGQVIEARVIVDRESGRSRGFGFVTFTSSDEASAAISSMDGKDLHGRFVRVSYANDRARGGGGYVGAGGYGGGGSGWRGTYGGSDGIGYGAGGASGGFGGSGASGGYGGDNYSTGGGGYGGSGYGHGSSTSGGNYGVSGGVGSVSLGGGGGTEGFTGTGSSGNYSGGGAVSYGSSVADQHFSQGRTDESCDNQAFGTQQDDLCKGNYGLDANEPDDYVEKRS